MYLLELQRKKGSINQNEWTALFAAPPQNSEIPQEKRKQIIFNHLISEGSCVNVSDATVTDVTLHSTHTIRGSKATEETGQVCCSSSSCCRIQTSTISLRWATDCKDLNAGRTIMRVFFGGLSKIKLYYLQYSSTGQKSWSYLSHGKWFLRPWCSSRSVALWEQTTQTLCPTSLVGASVDKLHLMHIFLSYI